MITVLFDGTDRAPWGRYLDGDPHVTREAPLLRRPGPDTNQTLVLDTIRARPSTKAEIAARTGLTLVQTVTALRELARQGHLRAEARESRRAFGEITVSVRYHAIGRWER